MQRIEVGNQWGKIAILCDKTEALDLAEFYGPRDGFYKEIHDAVERAYPAPEPSLDNPCQHTPSRCNGGGYDGCACGPYPKER